MEPSNMAKGARLGLFALACALASAGAHAQVFKCTDDSGKVGFSDQPCASAQKSEEVKIQPAAPQPQAPSNPEAEYEIERQRQNHQRHVQREEQDRRIDDARRDVVKLKTDNYDLAKCNAARARMADMQRRDPVAYNLDVSYFEFQQAASLYCGN